MPLKASTMKYSLETIRKNLHEAKDRLKDVQVRGDAALSDYDLSMGYDADFYLNRCPLLQNQVNFWLEQLEKKGNQLTLF